MPNHDMREPFEILGKWFLPDATDRQVAGRLSYRLEDIEVELMDALRPMQSGPILPAGLDTYPVVHGVTREQEAVSLFRCRQIGYSLNFASGGFGKPEKLWSHLAVVGAHLTEQQLYPELRCRIPGLQVWLSTRIIEIVQDAADIAFRVKNIPPTTVALLAIDAELDFKLTALGLPAHSTATIVASGWLHIRPREPKMLSWFLDQLWKATGLLALLAACPMPPDCIELKTPTDGFVLSVLLPRHGVKYCKYTEHHDFFVNRTRLGDNLSGVMVSWFDQFPRVELPANLALSTMASDDLWPHVRFLSLMQALEGLHRALFPGTYTTLRKRLNELAELLSVSLRSQILGSNEFPQSWVNTRHYYSHWDEGLRENILSKEAMYDVSIRLTGFLLTLYLHRAGVPVTTLEGAFGGKSAAARQAKQQNEKRDAERG
jgi:hypothetical protein